MKRVIGNLSIVVILFFFAAPAVLSIESKVFVFNIHYDSGKGEVKDFIVKEGFAPDRKIDEGDSVFELIDTKGDVLESFRFEIPLKEYTDYIDVDGKVTGNLIVYSEKDFAVVVPYYASAVKVRIVMDSQVVLYEDIREKLGFRVEGRAMGILIGVLFGLVVGVIGVYFARKGKRKS